MKQKLHAIWLLALYFWKHVFHKLTFTYDPGGKARFLDNYERVDGLEPLAPGERDALPAWQACIGCGLCDGLCDVGTALSSHGPTGTPSFVVGAAVRDLSERDDAARVAHDLAECEGCSDCEQVCPVGVPIRDVAVFLAREDST